MQGRPSAVAAGLPPVTFGIRPELSTEALPATGAAQGLFHVSTWEHMAKEELIEMHGIVNEVLPDSRYRVTLDNGHQLVAYSGGKLKKNHIRILAGDNVSLSCRPTT
jgi:translation initiation factor IF-1